jgi:transposase
MLLDQVDALTATIDNLTARIEAHIAALPAAAAPHRGDDPRPDVASSSGKDPNAAQWLSAIERLDEVPGIAERSAQIIIAEVGLDMTQFPTAGHLASWAKLSPTIIQSGPKTRAGRTGNGNRYLKGILGEAAAAAAKTDTFLAERYRRLIRRMPKPKALVALARSILVIVWHLLADPTARYHDLGPHHHEQHHNNNNRKTRDLVRQLQALGHEVTLNPAA